MKKILFSIFFVSFVMMVLFVGCTSQEESVQPQEEEVVEEPPIVEEPQEEEVVEEVMSSLSLQEVKKSTVHNRGAEGLAIYNGTVVTGSWNDNIVLSSLNGDTVKLISKAHKSDVVDIEFDANGNFFVSAGLDRTIKIWDTKGSLLKSIATPVNVIDVSVSTGVNPYIAAAALNGMVYIYEYENKKRISQFKATSKYSTAVQFINQNTVAGAGVDGYIVVWDIANSKELFRFKAHNQRINVLRINADADMLASAGWDKSVKIWGINDNYNEIASFSTKEQGAIESLAFSPDSAFILAGDRNGNIITWDIVKYLDMTLLNRDSNGNLITWDIDTKEMYSIKQTGTKRVYDIQFNADGDKAVATGYDTSVRFYTVER